MTRSRGRISFHHVWVVVTHVVVVVYVSMLFIPMAMMDSFTIEAVTTLPPQPKEEEEHRLKTDQPHIVFVLIDDLGWGDVGFHLVGNQGDDYDDVEGEQADQKRHSQRQQQRRR